MRTKMKNAMLKKLKVYEAEMQEVEDAFPSPAVRKGSGRFFAKS